MSAYFMGFNAYYLSQGINPNPFKGKNNRKAYVEWAVGWWDARDQFLSGE